LYSDRTMPKIINPPNPLTNYPSKPTYLVNGQMGANPIKPN
jgi:hypothetical protein